jgi:hydrogenase expression/formation protein HypC
MCLAVPGRVVEWIERESPFARAAVEFGGVRRQVSMAFVPEANEGDYVLVHAGIAITRIDADEAVQVVETLNELDLAGREARTPDWPTTTVDGGDEA